MLNAHLTRAPDNTLLSIPKMCDHPTGVRTVFKAGQRADAPRSYRGYCECGWEGERRAQAIVAEHDGDDHMKAECAVGEPLC